MQDSISKMPQQFMAVQQEQVPTELVVLPSNGVVYPVNSPVANAQNIAIRSMTARDEDILTSRALLKSGKAVSALLSNCIMTKGVDAGKLLAGDRNAILISIRITGYGQEYDVQITCPECGETTKKTIDLAELPIKRIPQGVEPVAPNTNEFEYYLPNSGKRVTFKLMTGDDEADLLASFERARKNGIAEEVVTTRFRHQVISIDGESDKTKLTNLIRNMPAKDSRSLRAFMDELTPGIELKTTFSCPSCDAESQEVEVPLGTEFFWPKS